MIQGVFERHSATFYEGKQRSGFVKQFLCTKPHRARKAVGISVDWRCRHDISHISVDFSGKFSIWYSHVTQAVFQNACHCERYWK